VSEKVVRAFVDRIEGDIAVLLVGDEGRPINIPVYCLPDNVEEGTVVAIRFCVDIEATKEAKKRTAALIERLRRRKRP